MKIFTKHLERILAVAFAVVMMVYTGSFIYSSWGQGFNLLTAIMFTMSLGVMAAILVNVFKE